MKPSLIEPRNQIFAKGYQFSSFVENVSKNVSAKYDEKLLNYVTKSATNGLKTTFKNLFRKQQKQLVT